jgi:hypothetical protein
LEFGVRLLFVLHHQIDVLRSFVLLLNSPSARLADRILMIHELRGSNPTPTKSSTSSAPLLCVLLYREFPVVCLVILQLCFDTHLHTQWHWDIFFPLHSTLAFCHHEKRPGCLWFNTRVLGGEIWEGLECLTAFLHPRANAPAIGKTLAFAPSWNFSFHGKKKKKRILSGFVGCFFWLSRFFDRRFLS